MLTIGKLQHRLIHHWLHFSKTGYTIKKVSSDIDIQRGNLDNWISNYKKISNSDEERPRFCQINGFGICELFLALNISNTIIPRTYVIY